MGHAGASRKSPNDVPWETLCVRISRPISAPLLTPVMEIWRRKTGKVPAPNSASLCLPWSGSTVPLSQCLISSYISPRWESSSPWTVLTFMAVVVTNILQVVQWTWLFWTSQSPLLFATRFEEWMAVSQEDDASDWLSLCFWWNNGGVFIPWLPQVIQCTFDQRVSADGCDKPLYGLSRLPLSRKQRYVTSCHCGLSEPLTHSLISQS